MSVRARLYVMGAIAIVGMVVLLGVSLFGLNRLAALQDHGFKLSQNQADAAEASWLGVQFYQVVADAIINRNIEQSRKDFAALRSEAEKDLSELAQVADTENRKAGGRRCAQGDRQLGKAV